MLIFFVIFLVICVILTRGRRPGGRNLYLVRDDSGNECLLLHASLGGRPSVFLVDTAYAGAPVLSLSFLARQAHGGCGGGDLGACMRSLRGATSEDSRAGHAVLRSLMANGTCRAFTSGCTMRLMGIGETTEAQSDMLLCPRLRIPGVSTRLPVDADIFVTNPLRGNPHILTSDYLLHHAPAVLCPKAGVLELEVAAPRQLLLTPTFEFHPARLVGGAFVVVMNIGGVDLDVVIDTGAAASLSVSSTSIGKLATCTRDGTARRSTQVGVNGERVCSDVHQAPVLLGGLDLGVVDVLFNSHPLQGADAYAGMGLLRAVDIWLDPRRVGFRLSGLSPSPCASASAGVCKVGAPAAPCLA